MIYLSYCPKKASVSILASKPASKKISFAGLCESLARCMQSSVFAAIDTDLNGLIEHLRAEIALSRYEQISLPVEALYSIYERAILASGKQRSLYA